MAEKVPESCCIKPKGDELSEEKILECQKAPESYDLKGCYEKLKDSVKNHKKKILGVALTILVIMVIIKNCYGSICYHKELDLASMKPADI